MRILITSFGTRGDIQPYVALAGALAVGGHDVTLAVPDAFRSQVENVGARFHAVGTQMLTMLQETMPELSGGWDSLRAIGVLHGAMREHLDEQWTAALATSPDLIVYHPKCLAGPHMAQALGVLGVLSIPLPFYTPTRAFPIPFLGGRRLPGWANRASYSFTRAATVLYGQMINDLRVRLGLRKISRLTDPLRNPDGSPLCTVYPYSRHVVPVPVDFPPSAHVTGYWFLPYDHSWRPSPRLVDFLAAGEQPVYVGFGSMGFGKGADERREAVPRALEANRLRGTVATGWGGLATSDTPADDVLVVDEVPHDWLFDRVAAVIHHGGAGSTAAALRAGKPSLICPFVGDQPFWGARVHALDAGPAPLPARRLTQGLAERLGDLLGTNRYRLAAAKIGEKIRTEDGLGCGVATIDAISRAT